MNPDHAQPCPACDQNLPGSPQRRCGVHLESMQKKGTLSQHFVTHVIPHLGSPSSNLVKGRGEPGRLEARL